MLRRHKKTKTQTVMAKDLSGQFKEDMNTIAKTIEQNINGIRTVTFNTIKGDLVRRIFNNGTATDGSPIGQYATSTKKQRERGGRQTAKVDLELTGTLRRAVIVGTESNKVVMGIVDNQEPKVSIRGGRVRITGKSDFLTTENAIQQEENFGKEIFAPSQDELEKSQNVFLNEIDRVVSKALGNKTLRIKK